jgi:glycosyltransferase A (GT-A) superfamily protein (DUF2064 family)
MSAPVQLVVVAKAPVPGRVKTRLCPPCTPAQAAAVAATALSVTLAAGDAAWFSRRVLLVDGDYRPPPGWTTVAQRGGGLDERLASGFADTALDGTATLLVGMDTPQVTPALLAALARGLDSADAVLAPAYDGGWWALALRAPYDGRALRGVPMSTPYTGAATATALRTLRPGFRLATGPWLRDVDTAADAWAVAAADPGGAFAAAVRANVAHRRARVSA